MAKKKNEQDKVTKVQTLPFRTYPCSLSLSLSLRSCFPM